MQKNIQPFSLCARRCRRKFLCLPAFFCLRLRERYHATSNKQFCTPLDQQQLRDGVRGAAERVPRQSGDVGDAELVALRFRQPEVGGVLAKDAADDL